MEQHNPRSVAILSAMQQEDLEDFAMISSSEQRALLVLLDLAFEHGEPDPYVKELKAEIEALKADVASLKASQCKC